MTTLRESLSDWTDADVAMFHFAVLVGIVTPSEPWGGKKYVFWSNNPTGNLLFDQLNQLVSIGAIEFDHDETRFRWNASFSPDSASKSTQS